MSLAFCSKRDTENGKNQERAARRVFGSYKSDYERLFVETNTSSLQIGRITTDARQPWTDSCHFYSEYLIIHFDYLIIPFDYLIIV